MNTFKESKSFDNKVSVEPNQNEMQDMLQGLTDRREAQRLEIAELEKEDIEAKEFLDEEYSEIFDKVFDRVEVVKQVVQKSNLNDEPMEDTTMDAILMFGKLPAFLLTFGGKNILHFFQGLFKKAKVPRNGDELGNIKDHGLFSPDKGKTPETIGGTFYSKQLESFGEKLQNLTQTEQKDYLDLLRNRVTTAEIKLKSPNRLDDFDTIVINSKAYIAENGRSGIFDVFDKLGGSKRNEILQALEKTGINSRMYTILSLDNLKYGLQEIADSRSLRGIKTLLEGNNIGNLDDKALKEILKNGGREKMDNIFNSLDSLIERASDKNDLRDLEDGFFQLNKVVQERRYKELISNRIKFIDNKINN